MSLIHLTFLLSNLVLLAVCQSNSTIPLGGNAYITKKGSSGSTAAIQDKGLVGWNNRKTVTSIYFKLYSVENYNVALRLSSYSGKSLITVSIKGVNSYKVTVNGTESYIQNVGAFTSKSAGYVKLQLQGVTKTGAYFGDVYDLIVSNIKGKISFISDPDDFYYGRRGPSVHLEYLPESENKLQYFYNEVKVPSGSDKVGCYFMANGFADGYFGMQRNDENSKRLLFSVFSDFKTNDPSMQPDSFKVREVKKGNNVTVQDFGNEGSGLQSFIPYDWKTGLTYQFLVYGAPKGKSNNTIFTGWFHWFRAPGSDWILISSLRKPKSTAVYLTDLYSFSENFLEDEGYKSRMGYFGNQWVRNQAGQWTEVTTARFTDDATGMHGREDYAGGLTKDKKQFFLKNCGFIKDHVPTDTYFTRTATNSTPNVMSLP